MNMPIAYQDLLKQWQNQQTKPIQRYTLPNGQYCWIRKAMPSNIQPWLYRLLALATKLSRLTVLTPSPKAGGTIGLQTEINLIQQLKQANILVPDILAHDAQALMMSDLGTINLETAWYQHQHDPQQAIELWQLGLNAIAQVHQANLHLSQCFARNMILTATQQIGFIDFEDNPRNVLSLTDCQIRDWLCYLHSGAIIMHSIGVAQEAQTAWQNTISQQPIVVQTELARLLKRIAWLRHFNYSWLGRDTQRLALMTKFPI